VESPRTSQIIPSQARKSLLTWVIVAVVLVLVFTVGLGNIWREGFLRPILNALLFLYAYLGQSFVLAIAGLTIVLRLVTLPVSISQVRTSRKTALLQPRLAELQKKYAGNQERLVQEQQKLYKRLGVNPWSGCLLTLVQFPIWVGYYQSITSILADTPRELMSLGESMYANVAAFVDIIPLQNKFLWLNLAQPDPYYILPVLVGVSMLVQQKMLARNTSATASDPQQQSVSNSMQIMMPLMFAYFTTLYASGLALYFVISNIVGILLQWGIERVEGPVSEDQLPDLAPANNQNRGSYGRKRQRRKKKR